MSIDYWVNKIQIVLLIDKIIKGRPKGLYF